MIENARTLTVFEDKLTALDLVMRAVHGKTRAELRRLILRGGMALNFVPRLMPEDTLPLHTGDMLLIGKADLFALAVMPLHRLETADATLLPLTEDDLDDIKKILPALEVSKMLVAGHPPALTRDFFNRNGQKSDAALREEIKQTLARALSGDMQAKHALAALLHDAAKTGRARMTPRMAAKIIREVLRRMIVQKEPKTEFLWKIVPHGSHGRIAGIAHLHAGQGTNENVWLKETWRTKEMAAGVMTALNDYAFTHLGFKHLTFQRDFSRALSAAHRNKMQTFVKKTAADGTWKMTRAQWMKMRAWLDSAPVASRQKPATPKKPQPAVKKKPKKRPAATVVRQTSAQTRRRRPSPA